MFGICSPSSYSFPFSIHFETFGAPNADAESKSKKIATSFIAPILVTEPQNVTTKAKNVTKKIFKKILFQNWFYFFKPSIFRNKNPDNIDFQNLEFSHNSWKDAEGHIWSFCRFSCLRSIDNLGKDHWLESVLFCTRKIFVRDNIGNLHKDLALEYALQNRILYRWQSTWWLTELVRLIP